MFLIEVCHFSSIRGRFFEGGEKKIFSIWNRDLYLIMTAAISVYTNYLETDYLRGSPELINRYILKVLRMCGKKEGGNKMNKKKLLQNIMKNTTFIFLCLAATVVILGHTEQKTESTSLYVPSVRDILENGYPENSNGDTYGIDIKDNTEVEPDLILAENADGVRGYIYRRDLDGEEPVAPEEAGNFVPPKKIEMYLQDGETKIGEFYLNE